MLAISKCKTLVLCYWSEGQYSNLRKTVRQFPKTLNIYIYGYLPRRNENMCSHKNLYVNVYNGFIHKNQNLKIA